MKKETFKSLFKSLRSQYRKINFSAYKATLSIASDRDRFKAYSALVDDGRLNFYVANGLSFDFSKFDKPTRSDLVVSKAVFTHLNYPLTKIKEIKWN